jgi:hypothetical protein
MVSRIGILVAFGRYFSVGEKNKLGAKVEFI